jgi:AraC-like DNA-binding protein
MGENLVKVWRAADLHDAEMLKGAYVQHVYPWHSHEALCLGLVVDGAIGLRTKRRSGLARRGSFVLINSDELHYGSPAAREGWRCRTIHIQPSAIRTTAQEITSIASSFEIAFQGPTLDDPHLARDLLRLHRLSERGGASLERQSLIVSVISWLLANHAETRLHVEGAAKEPVAVLRAREYLDENLSDKVKLDDLAAFAGLAPFRLLRAFHRAVGLTPHSYQMQARVRLAHSLIRQQQSLADVAVAVGFADQAHLTRVFKSIMGATPGQFRAAVVRTPSEVC